VQAAGIVITIVPFVAPPRETLPLPIEPVTDCALTEAKAPAKNIKPSEKMTLNNNFFIFLKPDLRILLCGLI
jgi:hypothetical protein